MSGIQFNTKSTFKMSTKTITIHSHRQGLTRAKLSLYTSFDYQKSRPIETNRSTITDHGSFDFFIIYFFRAFPMGTFRYVLFHPFLQLTRYAHTNFCPGYRDFFYFLLHYSSIRFLVSKMTRPSTKNNAFTEPESP